MLTLRRWMPAAMTLTILQLQKYKPPQTKFKNRKSAYILKVFPRKVFFKYIHTHFCLSECYLQHGVGLQLWSYFSTDYYFTQHFYKVHWKWLFLLLFQNHCSPKLHNFHQFLPDKYTNILPLTLFTFVPCLEDWALVKAETWHQYRK